MDVYDYIKQLKTTKVITIKQLKYIDLINFYVDDLTIYKFIICVNPYSIKRAKKFNLDRPYIIHEGINVKIKPFLKGCDTGRYILMYKPFNNEILICEGEDNIK